MKELRLTDGELQAIVAPAIRERLRAAGFAMGTSSGDLPSSFWMPVNLNLAGHVEIIRSEDGVWSFTQVDGVIADRVAVTGEIHEGAILGRHLCR